MINKVIACKKINFQMNQATKAQLIKTSLQVHSSCQSQQTIPPVQVSTQPFKSPSLHMNKKELHKQE